MHDPVNMMKGEDTSNDRWGDHLEQVYTKGLK